MSMLEIHADALINVNDAYHQFLLCYKAKDPTIYGIVEGKSDPSFYRGFIEANLPNDWSVKLIPANGKRKVIQAFGCFDWARFERSRICFFVDRDLSDFIGEHKYNEDNIYTTDCYSIENEIVNFNTFCRITDEVFNIKLEPSENKILSNLFERSLSEFKEAMVPIMSQIILWRRAGEIVYLNKFEPKDLFYFKDGFLLLKPEYQSREARLNLISEKLGIPSSSVLDIITAENEFRNSEGVEKYVRGKYLLWFMVEIIQELQRSITKIIHRYNQPPKMNVVFGIKNSMIYIAPRSRCPQSLRQFIARTHGYFINKRLGIETDEKSNCDS